jgi:hypothetical protein
MKKCNLFYMYYFVKVINISLLIEIQCYNKYLQKSDKICGRVEIEQVFEKNKRILKGTLGAKLI